MKDRSKQFSKDVWKDPTRSLNRLRAVEKKLSRLFRNYRKAVLLELNPPVTHPFHSHTQKAIINIGTASSGNYGHEGRPGQVGGSGEGAPKAENVKTSADLRRVADVSLPKDTAEWEYYYHATRFMSGLEAIEKEGIKTTSGEYAKTIWASKDEVRDFGAGYVIFRAPAGVMKEGVDLVERGLSYREWTTTKDIPAENIVRVVRAVPQSQDDYGNPIKGFTTNENELARYLLDTPIDKRVSSAGVPPVYQDWFKIPAEESHTQKDPVKLTTLEKAVMKAYSNSDYLDNMGDAIWVATLSMDLQEQGIKPNQVPGIISSLVKKGVLITDGTQIQSVEGSPSIYAPTPAPVTPAKENPLSKVDMDWFAKRMDALTVQHLIQPGDKIIEKELLDAYTHGTKFADIHLKPIGVRLGAPQAEREVAWKKVGDMVTAAKGEFKGVTEATNQNIRRAISDGMIKEKSMSAVVKDIRAATDDVGIVRARMIARTETMKAINEGAVDRYAKAGIEQVEWLAAEDERVCEECGENDGQIYDIDKAPECPAHPNCRCTLIPYSSEGLDESDEEEEATQKAVVNIGTDKSGNFGHSGRPGERGGSGEGGGKVEHNAPSTKLLEEWQKAYPKDEAAPFWNVQGEKNPKYIVVKDDAGKILAGATTVQKGLAQDILSIKSHSPGAGVTLLNDLKEKNLFLRAMASSEKSKAWFVKNGFVETQSHPGDYNVKWARATAHTQIGTAASGNRGHAGRPGERGGSAPGSGTSLDVKTANAVIKGFEDPDEHSFRVEDKAFDMENKLSSHNVDYGEDNDSAIDGYTRNDYSPINKGLRDGKISSYDIQTMSGDYGAKVARLDDLIIQSPILPDDVEMWRGVGYKSGRMLANAKIGDICEDKGFQSHSLSMSKALSFAKPWQPTEDPMERWKKGLDDEKPHRTLVRAITNGYAKGVYTNRIQEMEVVIGRNTAWEVVGKDSIETDKMVYDIVTVRDFL